METLTRVLNYNADDFFNYIRNIDYGYMDVKGKIHKISPNDDYSKLGGEPYVFSSPDQVVANNCGWCWDITELIRLWCETNKVEYKYIFFEYLSNDFHKTHTKFLLNGITNGANVLIIPRQLCLAKIAIIILKLVLMILLIFLRII